MRHQTQQSPRPPQQLYGKSWNERWPRCRSTAWAANRPKTASIICRACTMDVYGTYDVVRSSMGCRDLRYLWWHLKSLLPVDDLDVLFDPFQHHICTWMRVVESCSTRTKLQQASPILELTRILLVSSKIVDACGRRASSTGSVQGWAWTAFSSPHGALPSWLCHHLLLLLLPTLNYHMCTRLLSPWQRPAASNVCSD